MKQTVRRLSGIKFFGLVLLAGLLILGVYTVYRKVHAQHPVPHEDAGLQQIVNDWTASQSFSSAVSVQELTGTMRGAERNQNTAMVTASTYKVFVAYAILHEVEQNSLRLSALTSTHRTVQATLNTMILQSDNASAEALGSMVGWNHVDQLAAEVGATHTDINNYDKWGNATRGDKRSTAADLTTMLTKLQNGELLNPQHTQMLLDLMKNQVWRERIPTGIPKDITVADKPGWLSNIENDTAIVYGPQTTYVLSVMTNSGTTQPLASLSKLIYDYLETET